MKYDDLKNSPHFESDNISGGYIPIPHVEVSWDGSDFQVHSIILRGGKGREASDIQVYAAESDGEQGGYASFPRDADLKMYVLGIIEDL